MAAYPHSVTPASILRDFFLLINPPFSLPGPSSGCGGLVGHAGVGLVGGSFGDFQLHAQLLLIHQHLRRQAPAAQAGLEEGKKECEVHAERNVRVCIHYSQLGSFKLFKMMKYAFFLKVTSKDQYHSHVFAVNVKLEPAPDQLSLAQSPKTTICFLYMDYIKINEMQRVIKRSLEGVEGGFWRLQAEPVSFCFQALR